MNDDDRLLTLLSAVFAMLAAAAPIVLVLMGPMPLYDRVLVALGSACFFSTPFIAWYACRRLDKDDRPSIRMAQYVSLVVTFCLVALLYGAYSYWSRIPSTIESTLKHSATGLQAGEFTLSPADTSIPGLMTDPRTALHEWLPEDAAEHRSLTVMGVIGRDESTQKGEVITVRAYPAISYFDVNKGPVPALEYILAGWLALWVVACGFATVIFPWLSTRLAAIRTGERESTE